VRFLAIDFETADYESDSACAVGLVTVEGHTIVGQKAYLIRPPRRDFFFTYLHGISWDDVKDEPTFEELWPELERSMHGVEFLAAHNARFDQGVLQACCKRARIQIPPIPFQCTMKLSRQLWSIYPTKLPDVCRHFGITLDHHDAASDTQACARIMIEALKAMKK
jgi:DNA polymerase-3 subunit epsilon